MKIIGLLVTVILSSVLTCTGSVLAHEPFVCKTTLTDYRTHGTALHEPNGYERHFGVKPDKELLRISPMRSTHKPVPPQGLSPSNLAVAFAQYLAQDSYLNLYYMAEYRTPPAPGYSYEISSVPAVDLCTLLFDHGPEALLTLTGIPMILWPFHGNHLYSLNSVTISNQPSEVAHEDELLHPSALIHISDADNSTVMTLFFHAVSINDQNTYQLQVFEGHVTNIDGMTVIADTLLIPASSSDAEMIINDNNGEYIRDPENADQWQPYHGERQGYGGLIVNSKGSYNYTDEDGVKRGNILSLIQQFPPFIKNIYFPVEFGR